MGTALSSTADEFRQYAEEVLRWAVQGRKRAKGGHRACAHLDGSSSADRKQLGSERQIAGVEDRFARRYVRTGIDFRLGYGRLPSRLRPLRRHPVGCLLANLRARVPELSLRRDVSLPLPIHINLRPDRELSRRWLRENNSVAWLSSIF
jgi:hypothetical protein